MTAHVATARPPARLLVGLQREQRPLDHAVPEGETVALCGVRVDHVTAIDFRLSVLWSCRVCMKRARQR